MFSSQAFVLGLVGLAAAAPLAMPSSGLGQPCPTNGIIVCNGPQQFGLCSNGRVSWGSVAAGTECTGGVIVAINGTSAGATIAPSALPGYSTMTEVQPSPSATSSVEAPVITQSSPSAYSPPSNTWAQTTWAEASTSSAAWAPPTSTEPATSSTQAPVPYSSASSAAPSSTSAPTGNGDDYKVYMGNGSPSAGWPAMSSWASFEDMWNDNVNGVLKTSCASFNVPNNSDQENDDLKSAIQSVAQSAGIDDRFVFGVVLQESVGCVRVPTTNNGVVNPGLMQSHDGKGTCASASSCPSSEITQMITDGVMGTSQGPGLKELVDQSGGASSAQAYFVAARKYNSGSVASNGNLQCGIATHSYCSDLANRLTMQWLNGPSGFPQSMGAC